MEETCALLLLLLTEEELRELLEDLLRALLLLPPVSMPKISLRRRCIITAACPRVSPSSGLKVPSPNPVMMPRPYISPTALS